MAKGTLGLICSDNSPRIYGNEEHGPQEWLAAVPFVEPAQLDHGTLLAVLQQFVAFEHAYAQQQEMHAHLETDPNAYAGQHFEPPFGDQVLCDSYRTPSATPIWH